MPTPAGRGSESGEAAPIEEIGSRPNRAAYSQIAIVQQFAEVRFAPKTGKWRTPVAGPRSATSGHSRSSPNRDTRKRHPTSRSVRRGQRGVWPPPSFLLDRTRGGIHWLA